MEDRMNRTQIEASKIVLEVLGHIRKQFDIYQELESMGFAITSAFESGEAMLKTKIQAAEATILDREIETRTEDREKAVTEWAMQYRRECADFCKRYDLSARIQNPLMRLGDLTRKWRVPYTTVNGHAYKITEVPLQTKLVRPDLPVDQYPRLIDIVQEIVNGERVVGQIGERYREMLAGALLIEWNRTELDSDGDAVYIYEVMKDAESL
jgi:hypothetical protein